MGKIQVLNPKVASQIAAGEVVERPAAVVKELLENSLDAGGENISIEVRRGGLEEIKILDDGEGMDGEDLRMAFQRHATSKVSRIDELAHLRTFGFRGEALPSIASVSKVTLESSPDQTGQGTRIRVSGGELSSPEVIGHPRGTTVTVRSLFFNAPARRKFIRSAGTENDHIIGAVSRAAIAHFDRRFDLRVDNKISVEAPAASDRRERVQQIFGASVSDRLISFSGREGPYRVSGFASRPEFSRSNTRNQWLFVNGRPVRDRGLLHAIATAYHTLLPKGRFPFALVLLDIPPERVDFNVHPTKWEVRLADPRAAHDIVGRAIRNALEKERPLPAWGELDKIPESPSPGLSAVTPGPSPSRREQGSEWPTPGSKLSASSRGVTPAPSARYGLFEPSRRPELAQMVPLAQYRQSYILASESRGLIIIDQHAAHERILYEQLLRPTGSSDRIERQVLLFPVTVELTPGQMRRIEEGKSELEQLGFVVEAFGGDSLVVREVPGLLGEADVAALIRDLADEMDDVSGSRSLERRWDRLAATTACHAAIKVNFPLTTEKMQYLVDQLGKAAVPMSCPHGRPVILRLTHEDLEKRFLRR